MLGILITSLLNEYVCSSVLSAVAYGPIHVNTAVHKPCAHTHTNTHTTHTTHTHNTHTTHTQHTHTQHTHKHTHTTHTHNTHTTHTQRTHTQHTHNTHTHTHKILVSSVFMMDVCCVHLLCYNVLWPRVFRNIVCVCVRSTSCAPVPVNVCVRVQIF